jgi:glucose/mannose-6-phosphate isomerase
MKAIAYKWKIDFNENTKTQAFYNIFPELNHNEMVGWTNIKGNFHIILIKDEDDYSRVKKRMVITKELLKKQGISLTEIALTGSSGLTKIFSAIYIGDWTSYFLALQYGTDPTPVDMVEDLKKQLVP